MASPLVAALMDPNNIGMSEADHGGFGSTADKLKQGVIGRMFHGLATLPARAGQAAVDYGDPLKGTYDPAPIMEAALNLVGAPGIVGGVPAGALGMSAASRSAKNIDELRAVLSREHPQINQWVSERPNYVGIDKVVVPPEMRGQGTGTTFVKDVVDYGNAHGKPVALSPSSDFGGNKAQLEAWYKSLGFKSNKGRSQDFSVSESMIRYPEQQQ
jgi:GNAT superfamily N-acetyltransferase